MLDACRVLGLQRIEQLPRDTTRQAQKGQQVLAAIKAARHHTQDLASRLPRCAAQLLHTPTGVQQKGALCRWF